MPELDPPQPGKNVPPPPSLSPDRKQQQLKQEYQKLFPESSVKPGVLTASEEEDFRKNKCQLSSEVVTKVWLGGAAGEFFDVQDILTMRMILLDGQPALLFPYFFRGDQTVLTYTLCFSQLINTPWEITSFEGFLGIAKAIVSGHTPAVNIGCCLKKHSDLSYKDRNAFPVFNPSKIITKAKKSADEVLARFEANRANEIEFLKSAHIHLGGGPKTDPKLQTQPSTPRQPPPNPPKVATAASDPENPEPHVSDQPSSPPKKQSLELGSLDMFEQTEKSKPKNSLTPVPKNSLIKNVICIIISVILFVIIIYVCAHNR
jgi:hypothetical protein